MADAAHLRSLLLSDNSEPVVDVEAKPSKQNLRYGLGGRQGIMQKIDHLPSERRRLFVRSLRNCRGGFYGRAVLTACEGGMVFTSDRA